MKIINLTQGKVAIVDDDDFDFINQWKWYAHKGKKPRSSQYYAVRKCNSIYMHRVILDIKKGEFTDHINGNSLDNRKCNLRKATTSQNGANRCKASNNTSGYKNVTFHKQSGKWQAHLNTFGKCIYLGLFANPLDAAKRSTDEARKLFGEYAK